MARDRLTVRVSRGVFDELDRVLGPQRGPNGEPSVNDFVTIELLRIVETFERGFDELPRVVAGRGDYRLLVAAGVLVRGVAVVGQMVSDGSVELLSIHLDLETEWE